METKMKTFLIVFLMIFSGAIAQDTIIAPDTTRTNNQEWEQDEVDEVVDGADRERIIADAGKAKNIFMERNPQIKDLIDNSAGYAIFPNVGKGAYILGGAAGNGVVYEKEKLVGFAELRQVDIGLQLGGQAYRQIIFFETEQELNRFKEGNFEFGGNASAVIVDEGGAESINFNEGIAVVTMPKAGAMLEISIGGQKFNYGEIQ